jgi:uncharacterized RDD family membrane protein YckC
MMFTASTWRRLAAYWIDSMILAICWLPVTIQVLGSATFEGRVAFEWRWLIVGVLLQLFYKWAFLYLMGGTIGKLIMGLRVVPAHDFQTSLGLLQSFLRVFADGLSLFFGHAPRALALLRLDRTHISDWVAETRVMQFAPQPLFMKRHWVIAAFVILISFFSQFAGLYQNFRWAQIEGSQIIFDQGL